MGIQYEQGDILGDNGVIFNKDIETKYKSGRKAEFVCPKCGNTFICSIQSVKRNLTKSCGCLRREHAKNLTYKDITGKRFGKLVALYSLEKSDKNNRIVWHCKCDCGNECDVVGKDLRSGHTKSCGCLKSYCETIIEKILKDNNIRYEKQKTFKDAGKKDNNKSHYKFDFYLPDYNCCIEYDGIQHFDSENIFYSNKSDLKDNFDYRRLNDIEKTYYCLSNRIFIIRLPHLNPKEINIKDLLPETSDYLIDDEDKTLLDYFHIYDI